MTTILPAIRVLPRHRRQRRQLEGWAFGAVSLVKATDFNDLHQIGGVEAVKRCVEAPAIGSLATDGWPEPTPLPDALPPIDAFDAALLPGALRPWVLDVAHRMQCPADSPAVAALVGLSSLIGARAVIRPRERDDWQVVSGLWAAVLGRPGVKKSRRWVKH